MVNFEHFHYMAGHPALQSQKSDLLTLELERAHPVARFTSLTKWTIPLKDVCYDFGNFLP